MRIGFILKSFVMPEALKVGSPSPGLSLTSDNGGWVRSNDYIARKKVVIVFMKCLERQERIEWLKQFEDRLELFKQAECEIFAVLAENTTKLREYGDHHNLQIPLLYDPLSIDARRYGMGSRMVTRTVDGCVLVGLDGSIVATWRHKVDANDVLKALDIDAPTESNEPEEDVVWIESAEAVSKVDHGFKIIDVRTQSEYDADHVPGSIHMPIEQIQAQYKQLPQASQLIFICQAGGRAWSAAEFMSSIGSTNLFVVKGGMSAWNGKRITGGEAQ